MDETLKSTTNTSNTQESVQVDCTKSLVERADTISKENTSLSTSLTDSTKEIKTLTNQEKEAINEHVTNCEHSDKKDDTEYDIEIISLSEVASGHSSTSDDDPKLDETSKDSILCDISVKELPVALSDAVPSSIDDTKSSEENIEDVPKIPKKPKLLIATSDNISIIESDKCSTEKKDTVSEVSKNESEPLALSDDVSNVDIEKSSEKKIDDVSGNLEKSETSVSVSVVPSIKTDKSSTKKDDEELEKSKISMPVSDNVPKLESDNLSFEKEDQSEENPTIVREIEISLNSEQVDLLDDTAKRKEEKSKKVLAEEKEESGSSSVSDKPKNIQGKDLTQQTEESKDEGKGVVEAKKEEPAVDSGTKEVNGAYIQERSNPIEIASSATIEKLEEKSIPIKYDAKPTSEHKEDTSNATKSNNPSINEPEKPEIVQEKKKLVPLGPKRFQEKIKKSLEDSEKVTKPKLEVRKELSAKNSNVNEDGTKVDKSQLFGHLSLMANQRPEKSYSIDENATLADLIGVINNKERIVDTEQEEMRQEIIKRAQQKKKDTIATRVSTRKKLSTPRSSVTDEDDICIIEEDDEKPAQKPTAKISIRSVEALKEVKTSE